PLLLLFLNDPPPPRLPALSLHDALPISPLEDCEHCERAGESRPPRGRRARRGAALARGPAADPRRAVADGGVLSLGVLRHGHHQRVRAATPRSEEHTSELQSRFDLVCRLLLEKKQSNGSDEES